MDSVLWVSIYDLRFILGLRLGESLTRFLQCSWQAPDPIACYTFHGSLCFHQNILACGKSGTLICIVLYCSCRMVRRWAHTSRTTVYGHLWNIHASTTELKPNTNNNFMPILMLIILWLKTTSRFKMWSIYWKPEIKFIFYEFYDLACIFHIMWIIQPLI